MRKAFRMKLLPGCEAEYKRRHAALWHEMREMIARYGGSNYSIFLDSDTLDLFAVLELQNEAIWAESAGDPICRKWWEYMADIMETNADCSPKSADLAEVFHLD